MTPHERADAARLALADRYRDLWAALRDAEAVLLTTPVETLAAQPVRHLHSGARAEEEALDRALMAL